MERDLEKSKNINIYLYSDLEILLLGLYYEDIKQYEDVYTSLFYTGLFEMAHKFETTQMLKKQGTNNGA